MSAAQSPYHCIWYGQCHTDSLGRIQNCFYNGTAKPLNESGYGLLEKWCPNFLAKHSKFLKICLISYLSSLCVNYKHLCGVCFKFRLCIMVLIDCGVDILQQ